MKKVVFFLPAILFGLFLISVGLNSINLSAVILIIMPLIAGILLCRGMLSGGLVGLLFGIYCLSFVGTSHTRLELPIGMIPLIFYAVCSFIVYKDRQTPD